MDTWLKKNWTKVMDGTAALISGKSTQKGNNDKLKTVTNLEEIEA
jgi:hypothetical protein